MLPWTFMFKFLRGHMFSFLLGINLGAELLSQMVTPCLTYLSNCFPKQLHHVMFPPAVYKGFDFATFSSTLVFTCLLASRCTHECEVVSHYGFDLHFPGEHLFLYLLAYIFLGEMSTQILCPFFNCVVFFLCSCKHSLWGLDTSVLSTI